MPQTVEDIRGVLIAVVGGHVLLPNATVSEVITLSEPDRLDDAPAWLLGRVPWRGWRVPLFSFAAFTGLATAEPQQTARVCILKAFGTHKKVPFVAMLAQGFPRLTALRDDVVVALEDDANLPRGVLSRVRVRDDIALIPDMFTIEDHIAVALGVADESVIEARNS